MKTVHTTTLNICLCILSMAAANNIHAAPGQISQAPIIAGSSVPPNIFFLTDDSSSMFAEILTQDFAREGLIANAAPDGSATDDGDFIHRVWPGEDCRFGSRTDSSAYQFVLEINRPNAPNNACATTAEEEWRSRDHTFNQLYYNPNRKYEPWIGTDQEGNPFEDMDITQAKINPYDTSIDSKNTINLLEESAVTDRSEGRPNVADGNRNYYESEAWRIWCEDNNIDLSTCQGWRYYYYDDNGERQLKWVHELPEDGDNEINTQTNFANWFTYHRSRDHTAKYALSQVISRISYARLGFGAINNQNTAIAINNNSDSHRQKILSNLFSIIPDGGTPLRSALDAVGQYFENGTPLNSDTSSGFDGNSPILGRNEGGTCQRNTTIMMTDGFYGRSAIIVGNEDNGGANDTIYDGGSFGDAYSNTLADIAMHYFERDLAPDLANEVWPTQIEIQSLELSLGDTPPTYMHQHMNTYAVVFGLKGSLDPEQVHPTDPGFSWPNPNIRGEYKIDDVWHATYNGRGRFLSAKKPDELAAALSDALPEMTSTTISPVPIEVSEYRLNNDSKIFRSWFSPSDWSGILRAQRINNLQDSDDDQTLWDAGTELNNNTNRQIISFNGEEGIPFQWDRLSSKQQDLLAQGNPEEGESRLNYLRGDQSNEEPTGNYRTRNSLLGDIINSAPEYVGTPNTAFLEPTRFGAPSNSYYEFKNHHASRQSIVYVGANDGMLHGFNADNGEELLAYVPEALYGKLYRLTEPDYTHQYYVDSSPKSFDAYFAPRNHGAPGWHTILTGGLGAGGKGWYALNITNPDQFRERNANEIVLWEFGEGDDKTSPNDTRELSDIGYSFSEPSIIITNAEKNGRKRWASIVGNGYNSESGIAKLFIIFLDADPSDGWDEGPSRDYIEISTELGGSSVTDMNGLSSAFSIDANGDGIRDYVYAGDVKGNLWAFDISSNNANEWGVSYQDSGVPQPLFRAQNDDAIIQPITARPTAIRHPGVKHSSQTTPNILVYFGTGQYLTADDPSNTDLQSFYAVWDQGRGGLTRTDLTKQHINASYNTNTTGENQTLLDARFTQYDITVPYQDPDAPRRFGWFFDLNDSYNSSSGERLLSSPIIQDIGSGIHSKTKIVYFYTFQPNPDLCSGGGSGWLMSVNALNGAPPPDTIFNLNYDSRIDINDEAFDRHQNSSSVTSGIRATTPLRLTESQAFAPTIINRRPREIPQRGRLSWRELRQ